MPSSQLSKTLIISVSSPYTLEKNYVFGQNLKKTLNTGPWTEMFGLRNGGPEWKDYYGRWCIFELNQISVEHQKWSKFEDGMELKVHLKLKMM